MDPMVWIHKWERYLLNWNITHDVFPNLESIWGRRPSYVDDDLRREAFQKWEAAVTRRSKNYWGVK
jgi:hypothetical protein